MKSRTDRKTKMILCATGLAAAKLTATAHAGITIDGSLDTAYGAPLAVQTNNTQFGDSTDPSNASGGGSELDAAYGTIQNGYLDLFLAGNLEAIGNHYNIFIADGRTTGQNTLSLAPQSGPGNQLGNMNGSSFSPGFYATYALDISTGNGPPTAYVNGYNLLTSNASGSYLNSITLGDGIAHNLSNGIIASFNNTNITGVSGDGTTPANQSAAAAVSTGLELSIPLSILASPRGAIQVLADVNGMSNTSLANQFLPGLPTQTGNVGGGGAYAGPSSGAFNFSSTPGQYFTVPAAAGGTSVYSTWNASTGGSWNTASNWLNGKIPYLPGDTATFGTSITAPSTVTLDGNKSVGQITFNNTNSYNIAQGSGGTLTINDTGDIAGVNPLITVSAGSHVISAPVSLFNGVTVTTASGSTLTISGVLSGTGSFNTSGFGTLALKAANTFTSTAINVLSGTLELDNASAAAGAQIVLGDPNSDSTPATLNVGVAGLTFPTAIVTNQDDATNDNFRTISTSFATGTLTMTGPLSINGGVVFSTATGTTITYSGVISDSQLGGSSPTHDVLVGNYGATSGGTVILSGQNTFSNAAIVNAGTLSIPATAGLSCMYITANTGGTIQIAGSLSQSANLYANGTIAIAAAAGPGISTRTLASLNPEQGGTITLSSAAVHANRTLYVLSGLTIAGTTDAWTGTLDVGNNDLDIVGGSLSQVTDQIKQGFNEAGGAKFNGLGITSTAAASDTRHLTTLGVIINSTPTGQQIYSFSGTAFDGASPGPTDILVKYTYFGDANLDGKVDGSDYSLIDAGYASNKAGFTGTVLSGWYNGDFNYDGVIDGSDYALIDNAFNNQAANLSTAAVVASITAQVAPAAVPEPAGLAAAAIAGLALLRRRRSPGDRFKSAI